jgi:hypothetical protein
VGVFAQRHTIGAATAERAEPALIRHRAGTGRTHRASSQVCSIKTFHSS